MAKNRYKLMGSIRKIIFGKYITLKPRTKEEEISGKKKVS